MWFAAGIIVGILLTCLVIWLEKKFFVLSDFLFDRELKAFLDSDPIYSMSNEAFDFEEDKPRGKPISFKEWQKKFVKGKNGH